MSFLKNLEPDLTLTMSNLNTNHHQQQQFEASATVSSTTKEEGGEGSVRGRKRPRTVWTLELHKKFVDAVELLGESDAVPTKILRLMGVDGLTRANIASHLQKYRAYLKEMQSKSQSTDNLTLMLSNLQNDSDINHNDS